MFALHPECRCVIGTLRSFPHHEGFALSVDIAQSRLWKTVPLTNELKKIWWYRARMYHHFEIAKGKKKTRVISAPDPRLKSIQRKIAGLLDQMYQRRDPVHGFVADRSVKTNAQSHLRGRYILNVDLKAFFPR